LWPKHLLKPCGEGFEKVKDVLGIRRKKGVKGGKGAWTADIFHEALTNAGDTPPASSSSEC
jgi:hypothetical protein